MICTVLNVRDYEFEADDGSCIEGVFIYLEEAASEGKAVTRRYFVSNVRMLDFVHQPLIGDRVRPVINNGKLVDMLKA